MDVNFLALVLIGIAFVAGIVGALTGLGGGAFVIPIMVLFLHIDMHYALAAGLFAVIATSMGTSVAYLKRGFINARLGIFLEVGASCGAILGAYVTRFLSGPLIKVIFGGVFIGLALFVPKRSTETFNQENKDRITQVLKLSGTYMIDGKPVAYHPCHSLRGFFIMIVAGIASGLLGIGAGVLKVLAMDLTMHLPYKISTSTSNFIIGITAAAGIGVFYHLGYVEPLLVTPIVVGVFFGALVGTRIMPKLPVSILRKIFTFILIVFAVQMIYAGMRGV